MRRSFLTGELASLKGRDYQMQFLSVAESDLDIDLNRDGLTVLRGRVKSPLRHGLHWLLVKLGIERAVDFDLVWQSVGTNHQ